MNKLRIFYNKVFTEVVDASSLAAFRFLFGTVMVWEVLRYVYLDRIDYYYIYPIFWFPYPLTQFVAPLSGYAMYAVFGLMGLSALGIALGCFFRLSAIGFTLIYTYVFLIDQAQYNNHYYFICLVGFLLCFTNANRRFSIDKRRAKKMMPITVPMWQPLILRIQVLMVYFGGGIAKLNHDWLQGKPMDMWLADRWDYPILGPFFETQAAAYFFSYGGLFFDLFIGFVLWHPGLRFVGFVGVLFFNLMNTWLFSIGVFPFLMICATVLFCEFDWPRGLLQKFGLQYRRHIGIRKSQKYRASKYLQAGLVVYLILQVTIPLRHWLYPGNVSWTEEGHNFSWHMKLRDKSARVNFIAEDRDAGIFWHVDLTDFLTRRQIGKMADEPFMLHQFALFLGRYYQDLNQRDVAIYVDVWASLNGRPYQRLVASDRDLAQTPLQVLLPADWVLPLNKTVVD